MRHQCAHCGATFDRDASAVNRAKREGRPLYCSKPCHAQSRKKPVSAEDKKAAKALYDENYRKLHAERLKANKAAYYQRTRDPEKERVLRKARAQQHIEYCRRPEYKAYKAGYDKVHRAKAYGEFGDAYRLLLDLEKEIRLQASAYEVRKANGYYKRSAVQRRRDLWFQMRRN